MNLDWFDFYRRGLRKNTLKHICTGIGFIKRYRCCFLKIGQFGIQLNVKSMYYS